MSLFSLLLPLQNYEQEFIALKRSSFGEGWIYVNLALSNVCNYKCSYCSPALNDGSKNTKSLNDIKNFITHITNQA